MVKSPIGSFGDGTRLTVRPMRAGEAEVSVSAIPTGAKDRRVRFMDTTSAPNRWICYILTNLTASSTHLSKDDGATGWLAGQRVLVTAGHVIMGGHATEITVIPGCNGVDAENFITTPNGWFRSSDLLVPHAYSVLADFAFIIIPEDLAPLHYGFFNSASYPTNELLPDHHGPNVVGYAGEKPFGTMWGSAGNLGEANDRMLWYEAQTSKGDSGAPVFIRHMPPIYPLGQDDDGRLGSTVIGIHTGTQQKGALANGIRITDDIIGMIDELNGNPDSTPSGLVRVGQAQRRDSYRVSQTRLTAHASIEIASTEANDYEKPVAVRSRRASRKATVENTTPVVDTVFLLEAGDMVHLTPDCPALKAGASEPEWVGIPVVDDMDELAAQFEAPICKTCINMVMAGSRVVRTFDCELAPVEICGDRIRVPLAATTNLDDLFEIPYFKVVDFRPKRPQFFSTSPRVVITYECLLPNAVVTRKQVHLPFETGDMRDEFLAALDRAMPD